jgi:hypothetical protein
VKSIKRYFMVSTHPATRLPAFWPSQNATWRDRESDVSSGRMALRTQCLPSSFPKIRLLRSRESDVSRCWKSMRNHFLPSGQPLMRLGLLRNRYFKGETISVN